MTASVLQERATDAAAGGASIALAFSANVTVASALHVIGTCDSSGTDNFNTCSDTVNGSLGAIVDNINDATNAQRIGHFEKNNSAGGADTVTLNFVNTPSARGLIIREIGGVTTTALDGHNGNDQTAPGTGADGVVSGLATDANAPVLMSAVSMDCGASAATPAAGTGFTLGINGWTFGGATNLATSEHQRFTTTANRQATFTAGANVSHITVMAMFDEISVSGSNALMKRAARLAFI